MAAEDISGTATFADGVPNLNMKMCYAVVTCTENDDYVDFANIGMSAVYMAFATVGTTNAAEVVTIDGTKVIFGAGGTDQMKVLAIGI